MKFSLLASLIFSLAVPCMANAQLFGREIPPCQMTPSISPAEKYPEGSITRSNSLAQPAGKSIPAPGEPLIIYGRLTDANCVPLMGAHVDIWQADTTGKFTAPEKGKFADPYPLFAGNGRATTDNEGRFNFFTIFPGSTKIKMGGKEFEGAPHINIRIKDKRLKAPFFTVMYFSNDRRNAEDPSFKRLKPEVQPLVGANIKPINPQFPGVGLNAYFDITLPGKDGFHKY